MASHLNVAHSWTGYVLESNAGGFYVGITRKLPQRLRAHWGRYTPRSNWWNRQQGPKRIVSLYLFPENADAKEVREWERSKQRELIECHSLDMVGGCGNPKDTIVPDYGGRVPFSSVMLPELRRQFHDRCEERGFKLYIALEDAVRDWLAKHGDEAHN